MIHTFIQRHQIVEAFSSFWGRNPALYFGLSLLLGTASAFQPNFFFILIFLFLNLSSLKKQFMLAALLCFTFSYFNAGWLHPKKILPNETVLGKGIFHIEQVKQYSSPFHRSILYKGNLTDFKTDQGIIDGSLPCFIYLPFFGKRPPANTDYEITGKLCQKGDHAFVLKPEKKISWTPISSRFNLAEWRFALKQKVSNSLKKEIEDPAVRTLLIALSTGEIDERILSMEFSKVGLQHILAISGFHFALAALFLNFLFRLIMPYRASAAMLIISLTLYYLFLGNAPSIQRAYTAILLVAIGQLFALRISGLNALGVGLIIELLIEPLVVTELSFQLTFLCTLAILLFYPIVHQALCAILPERTFAQASSMGTIDRHGYIFSAFLRKALALNLAVHVISLPVLLHLFHKFPLLSIAYNLFFPFCISLSMLMLFTALLFTPFIPFLGHFIHSLNNTWTSSIMTLTSNPPAFLDFSIRTQTISFSLTICFLAVSFFLGIIFYEKERTI